MTSSISVKLATSAAGFWSAFFAYIFWGVLPIYWKELEHISALEILAQRLWWSFLILLLFLLLVRRLRSALSIFKERRTLLILTITSLLIAINWFIYIWAVNNGQIVATSLGYYLVPIFNILCGTLLFKERPSRPQWIAVFLAGIGVAIQVIVVGELPWVSLVLSLSFTAYGVLRKTAPVAAIPGLFIETLLLIPLVVAYLAWLHAGPGLSFGANIGLTQSLLLVSTGLVTTLSMVLFAHGARNIRLTTLGLLQYIAPSIALLLGVLVYQEAMGLGQMLSFMFIWCGLIIYTLVSLRQQHHLAKIMKHTD